MLSLVNRLNCKNVNVFAITLFNLPGRDKPDAWILNPVAPLLYSVLNKNNGKKWPALHKKWTLRLIEYKCIGNSHADAQFRNTAINIIRII
jgi:hypothetical protein